MGRATRLLGQDVTLVTPILVWHERETHFVVAGGDRFVAGAPVHEHPTHVASIDAWSRV